MRQTSVKGIADFKLGEVVEDIQGDPAITEIGEIDLEQFTFEPGKLNVVCFYAPGSESCAKLDARLVAIIEANARTTRLGRFNVNDAKSFAIGKGVKNIPETRLYIDGKLVDGFTGAESEKKIQSLIATHSSGIAPATDPSARLEAGMDDLAIMGGGGNSEEKAASNSQATAKPLEQALKPMSKDWLPPGMTPKHR